MLVLADVDPDASPLFLWHTYHALAERLLPTAL